MEKTEYCYVYKWTCPLSVRNVRKKETEIVDGWGGVGWGEVQISS